MIASNGQGSVSTYELGKMLETGGLKLSDVDVKVLPFTQMGARLRQQGDRRGAADPALHV